MDPVLAKELVSKAFEWLKNIAVTKAKSSLKDLIQEKVDQKRTEAAFREFFESHRDYEKFHQLSRKLNFWNHGSYVNNYLSPCIEKKLVAISDDEKKAVNDEIRDMVNYLISFSQGEYTRDDVNSFIEISCIILREWNESLRDRGDLVADAGIVKAIEDHTDKALKAGFAQYDKAQEEKRDSQYDSLGYDIEPLCKMDIGTQGNTYIERTAYLDIIEKCFSSTESKNILFVRGMGGMGKSELLRGYASTHHEKYKSIIWLVCDDNASQAPTLNGLLEKYEHDTRINATDKFLEQSDSSTLLIVDNYNYDGAELFLSTLQNRTGMSDVLISTRLPDNGDRLFGSWLDIENALYRDKDSSESDKIELDINDLDFAKKVFQVNYEHVCTIGRRGRIRALDDNDLDHVASICRILGFNTMAIALTAVHLREFYDGRLSDFVSSLETDIQGAFPEYGRIRSANYDPEHRFDSTVYDILKQVIFEKMLTLLHQDGFFTLVETEFLSILSLTPAEEVDKQFIFQLLGDDDTQHIAESSTRVLVDLGWVKENRNSFIIHPLITEFFSKDHFIWNASFYIHSLENALLMDERIFLSGIGVIREIRKLLEWQDDRFVVNRINSEVKSVQTLLVDNTYDDLPAFYALLITELMVVYELKKALTVGLDTYLIIKLQYEYGSAFVKYNIQTKQSDTILDLRHRIGECRYWEKKDRENICLADHNVAKDASIVSMYGNVDIENIYLPESVCNVQINRICFWAFLECDGFKGRLKLPDSLTSIGDFAFFGCSGFTGSLELPDTLTSIGNAAFGSCSGFTGSLGLPDSLTSIGVRTFAGCSGFTGILKLPGSLTSIGEYAFSYCSGFTGILELPGSLTSIGESAFYGCDGFSAIIIKNPKLELCNKIVPRTCIIVGHRKSSAECYAIMNDLPYESIEDYRQ